MSNENLGDMIARLHNLKEGAKQMYDEARKLANQALSLEEDRTGLKRKYFEEFAKIVTPKKALRFFQIEKQINTAIDLRIAAALPLIK